MVLNRIVVEMGNGIVARAPYILLSSGLGSCVVVTLYDTPRRIGGLAHIMLPCSTHSNGLRSSFRCADTAIPTLLEKLRSKGGVVRDIVAKMVGGARMFPYYDQGCAGIGEQNIVSIGHILKREGIPLAGRDIGGNHGRSVEFHLESGRLIVRVIGKHDKEL